MILEETVNQFTDNRRTALNVIGNKEIVVKRLSEEAKQEIDKTADILYLVLVVQTDMMGFNTQIVGVYKTLLDVKNHLIGFEFTPYIDPNAWELSNETGGY